MYGQSPYGWQTRPRATDIVELPLAPVRQSQDGGDCRNCRCVNWYAFGVILSILSAASLALGVADVVVTYQKYMAELCPTNAGTAPCDSNVLIFTWIGVGIWGSLTPFILGIMSIRRASNPSRKSTWWEMFAFLSTFIFTPAMIALSAVELWKGWSVYYWSHQTPLTSDDYVKFALPVAIGGLAFLEHIMAFIVVGYVCGCCDSDFERDEIVVPPPAMGPRMVAGRPGAIVPQRAAIVGCRSGGCGQSNYPAPNFSGSFYSSALPVRPTTYNHFTKLNSPYGSPNSAYNFYR